jgi:hypothetical protein
MAHSRKRKKTRPPRPKPDPRQMARRLESNLAKLLTGITTAEAALVASELIDKFPNEAKFPPSRLLRLVEAASAYGNQHQYRHLGVDVTNAALSNISEMDELSLRIVVEENGTLFPMGVLLFHQQLPVLYGGGRYPFRRHLCIAQKAAQSPHVTGLLQQRFGFTVEQFQSALLFLALPSTTPTRRMRIPQLAAHVPAFGFSPASFESLVQWASATPAELGQRYLKARHETDNETFWGHCPSLFLETPYLRLHDDLQSPSRTVVDQFVGTAIWSVTEGCGDDVQHAMSNAFEFYVSTVLSELPNARVLRGSDLSSLPNRRCDAICELADGVILIECKAIRSRMKRVTPNSLRDLNGLKHMGKAFDQLADTTTAVRNGVLESKGIARNANLLALAISADDLLNPNHEESLKVIHGCMKRDPQVLAGELVAPPQAFGVGSLEKLVAIAATGKGPFKVIPEKQPSRYPVEGDWDGYLGQMAERMGARDLRVWIEAFDRYQALHGPGVAHLKRLAALPTEAAAT